jgi:hypothetical protein
MEWILLFSNLGNRRELWFDYQWNVWAWWICWILTSTVTYLQVEDLDEKCTGLKNSEGTLFLYEIFIVHENLVCQIMKIYKRCLKIQCEFRTINIWIFLIEWEVLGRSCLGAAESKLAENIKGSVRVSAR